MASYRRADTTGFHLWGSKLPITAAEGMIGGGTSGLWEKTGRLAFQQVQCFNHFWWVSFWYVLINTAPMTTWDWSAVCSKICKENDFMLNFFHKTTIFKHTKNSANLGNEEYIYCFAGEKSKCGHLLQHPKMQILSMTGFSRPNLPYKITISECILIHSVLVAFKISQCKIVYIEIQDGGSHQHWWGHRVLRGVRETHGSFLGRPLQRLSLWSAQHLQNKEKYTGLVGRCFGTRKRMAEWREQN